MLVKRPVNPKGNQPWTLERLMLKLQYFGCLMQRADSLGKILMLGKTEGRRRRGWQRMRWLDVFTNSMDMSLSKLQEIVKDREVWYAAVHGVTKNWTCLRDWTTTKVNRRISSPSRPNLYPHGLCCSALKDPGRVWSALNECQENKLSQGKLPEVGSSRQDLTGGMRLKWALPEG